ncbi:D-alanine--D-alanine ligase [Singulisphaera sp. Ch08]|uniref:D-alanine--D-alanine ligase n=1 Tax=Singulisphaera sp. Ch08 TaxID=3120278 RepID=A0AAU7CCP9_9BACT
MEREVSLSGGTAVAAACRALGHDVTVADVSPDDLTALDIPTDVVFPVLHGKFGEDGVLQEILEARNWPYVGSGPAASRRAMDKVAAKIAWNLASLPTPPWVAFDAHPGTDLRLPFSPPAVVKPIYQGSSIGIVFADAPAILRDAVVEGVREWGAVLVEPQLAGRELTVGILGRDALPVIEVRTPRTFYDYEAKYRDGGTSYHFQSGLPNDETRCIQGLALAAFEVLGCRDMGRVDLIIDDQRGPQILEVNTIPGFTDHSLLPKAAAHAGLDLPALVASLLEMALSREARP